MKSSTLSLLIFNAAVFAYIRQRRHIRAYQRLRHQPIKTATFGEMGIANDKPRFVLLGDSRAAAWPNPAHNSLTIINRGINGDSAQQTLHRLNDDAIALRPKITLLQIGANDLTHIGVFNSAERHQIIHNTQQTITTITNRLTTASSHVILSTIFPTARPLLHERLWNSAETTHAISTVNQHIHTLATTNVTIFDTVPILSSDGNTTDKRYAADYLHLNSTGYDQLNQHLTQLLPTIHNSQFAIYNS